MTQTVIKHFGFFSLNTSPLTVPKSFITYFHITKYQLRVLGELYVNILYANLRVTEKIKQKLVRHKKLIEYLSNKKTQSGTEREF